MTELLPEASDSVPPPLAEFDPPDLQRWLNQEMASLDLRHHRLNQRCRLILHRLCRHPHFKFNAAAKNRSEAKAAYGFVDQPRIDEQQILQPHYAATTQRIRQHPVVLLVHDTTENDLTRRHERMAGAGPLNDPQRWGLFVHLTLAFTPDAVPLGLTDVFIWARDPETFDRPAAVKAAERKIKPIEEKESMRWVASYQKASAVAADCPDTHLIAVCDSEGDVFELFFAGRAVAGVRKADWITRACQDRAVTRLHASDPAPARTLFAEVGAAAVGATAQVDVSERLPKTGDGRKRKQARAARQAVVTIQAKRVQLRVPHRPKGDGASAFEAMTDVTVNAVLVREVAPPAGAEAIAWLLLTSLPIDNLEQVQAVVRYYCVRWQIEIYFRVLKSGCEVEKSQLETAQRYRNYLGMCLIVAWRVMYLMMLGRRCPEMPCEEVLDQDEWQALYTVVQQQAPPEQAPPLGEVLLLLAALGGFLGRPSDGEPGPKVVWRGLERLADILLGWRAHAILAGSAEPSARSSPTDKADADPATRPKDDRAGSICVDPPFSLNECTKFRGTMRATPWERRETFCVL
jgi:hypothetical protein